MTTTSDDNDNRLSQENRNGDSEQMDKIADLLVQFDNSGVDTEVFCQTVRTIVDSTGRETRYARVPGYDYSSPEFAPEFKYTVDSMVKMSKLVGPSDEPEGQIRDQFEAYALLVSPELLTEAVSTGLTFAEWSHLKKSFRRAEIIIEGVQRTR